VEEDIVNNGVSPCG